ncbi:hypothetical protein B9Z55_015599 [Caenorhabditis nigoni]|uniref:Uncharacterized protein n=1 Tax=Caenorhabditis nigoni TaxID=1611254 RepID=A0A2G5UAY6_9PELO|nr:hypothetical protein B9Z55_015599 [Caenorhabditis nigoni]
MDIFHVKIFATSFCVTTNHILKFGKNLKSGKSKFWNFLKIPKMRLSNEEEKCLLFEYEHEKSKPSDKSRKFVNANRLFYTLFIVSVLVFVGLYAAVSWHDNGISNYFSTVNDSKLVTNDSETYRTSEMEISENSTIIPKFTTSESVSTTPIPFKDDCSLPVFDPWDETVKPFLIDSDHTKYCDRSWKPYTELKNGTWRIVQEKPGMSCKARCHHFPDLTSSIEISDWFEPGPTDCEFLEAACWEKGVFSEKEVYGYIHTQMPPSKRENLEKPKIQKSEHPDVFVFILDSISTNSAKRSLPKTLEHFKSKHGAIDFPFLSQVGARSQMNAFALFFGKQVENGTIKGGKPLVADWAEEEYCKKYLDDKPNIFRDFGDAGYTTAHIDDWYMQTLTCNPICLGFEHYYTNHTFYPFTYINEYSGIKKTRESLMGGDLCRESYHGAIDYFDQFAEAYSDRPMFALQWFVMLSHEKLTSAERGDAPILAWFERNFELFDNAFVILTSDHGFRGGTSDYYQTEIGAFEKHTPFLQISVPKKYRDNGILEVMRENAGRLQSHYDTRATILDILKVVYNFSLALPTSKLQPIFQYQPSSNFTDRSTLKIPDEKGNSYLRHQPSTPRNCEHLPIPQQYCLCKSKSTNMMNVDGLADRLGNALLKHIEDELVRMNLSSLCHSFKVTEVLSLDLHGDSDGSKSMYHISVKTNHPAHFDAVITEDKETGKMEFNEIERLDRYGTTANCSEPIHFTHLCYCKN